MVTEVIIVKKYALALFINTEQLSMTDSVFAELNNFNVKIKQNKSVKKLLFNKYVPKKVKSVFCNTILNENKVSAILKNFIVVLVQRKRLYLLSKIVKCFEGIIDNHNGIVDLKVKLANELDQDNANNVLEGYYIQLSYFLTNDKHNYNTKSSAFGRVKPHNKKGAWEIAYRYSDAEANSGSLTAGNMENNSVALNYYATDNVRLMTNYINSNLDSNSTYGDDAEIFTVRAQIDF